MLIAEIIPSRDSRLPAFASFLGKAIRNTIPGLSPLFGDVFCHIGRFLQCAKDFLRFIALLLPLAYRKNFSAWYNLMPRG